MRSTLWREATLKVALTIFAVVIGGNLLIADGSDRPPPGDTSWSYEADAEDLRPVARSISLLATPPQDLIEEIDYRGKLRRYGQLRYGSENSRRVVIVVDELEGGQYEFYLDADRNRRLTDDEVVPGTGRTRSLPLETEIIQADEPWQVTRQVQLRLGVTGNRLAVATLGYLEGRVRWPNTTPKQELPVRRIDGNANGLFADARDRVLIDVNNDGRWDRVTEQFAYLPVLNISGRRYAVRSDRMGTQLSLSELTGVGQLRVVVAQLPAAARIIAFEAMVFSDDGSAYSLKNVGDPLTVPIGRYTLGSVTMTIDTGDRQPWHFVFSRSGSVGEDDWVYVAAEADVALEAVGRPRFELDVKVQGSAGPGDRITVSPRLYTEDGLLINLSCRGRQMGSFDNERFHNRCDVKLMSAAGDTLTAAQSGFA